MADRTSDSRQVTGNAMLHSTRTAYNRQRHAAALNKLAQAVKEALRGGKNLPLEMQKPAEGIFAILFAAYSTPDQRAAPNSPRAKTQQIKPNTHQL